MGLSYWKLKTDSTFCPDCNKNPWLLGTDEKNMPMFYVCSCGFMGHIGVGPVKCSNETELAEYLQNLDLDIEEDPD